VTLEEMRSSWDIGDVLRAVAWLDFRDHVDRVEYDSARRKAQK